MSSSSLPSDWTVWLPRGLRPERESPVSVTPEIHNWYHIRILIDDKEKKEQEELITFDLSESGLKRGITLPYSQGKRFLFKERFVEPSYITGIRIIATKQSITKWPGYPDISF